MTVEIKRLETLDPIAFVAALISAPVLVALMGFWVLLVPVFAMTLGGPVYLVVGTPILLWMVTRVPMDGRTYANVAMMVQTAIVLFVAALCLLSRSEDLSGLLAYSIVGLIFAPIWAAMFAVLYRRWHRPARLFPVM